MLASSDETPAKRLKHARKAAGYRTARDATAKFGWAYSGYVNHENGTRAFRDAVEKYAAAFGTTIDYLLTGKVNEELLNYSAVTDNLRVIRKVQRLKKTDLNTFEHILMGGSAAPESGPTDPLPSQVEAGPRTFTLAVEDNALAVLAPGNIAYFDPDAEFKTGDIIAALVSGFPEIVIRKFRLIVGRDSKAAYELVAFNPDFPSFSSETHQINPIGRLIGAFTPF